MVPIQIKAKAASPARLNNGFSSTFQDERMTIGLVVPIEEYSTGAVPSMSEHLERVQLAEHLGFSAVWLRDVPYNVPSFGDAGQVFDPFVYLGLLAGQTSTLTLGVASLILPLRHPAHVAKAAASVNALSDGRLILGIASGDRPEEYPAMNINYSDRGRLFRESFEYIQKVAEPYPKFKNIHGQLNGSIDMLPKIEGGQVPLLITGSSQQDSEWLAHNGDGWITYPRSLETQYQFIQRLRTNTTRFKPVMEPLYIDLAEDADEAPQPLHLGYRLGVKQLLRYLKSREAIGVNHIALNLRFNQKNTIQTLQDIAETVLTEFTYKE